MRNLADSYARELDAQFRTLNHFAAHAGEIGRAHEHFLRGVLERFLPERLRLGTGFSASPNWTSTQQDILVYDSQRGPLLFSVGDCVVVDSEATCGLVEVKSRLATADLDEYLARIPDLEAHCSGSGKFYGLYAWEGPTLETMLERIWEYIRLDPGRRRCQLPCAVYVRSRFLIFPGNGGNWWDPPLRVMRLGQGSPHSEGEALLGFVGMLWYRLQHACNWPWWLKDWHEQREEFEGIPWPHDLRQAIQQLLPEHPAPPL